MCGGAGTSGGKCGKNRVVVSYICRDLSILLAEDPEKERKQAHSRGRRDERAGLSTDNDDKGREMWIFLGKVSDVWKILLGAAAFSAVFNMIFWALEKKEIFLGVLHIAVQKVRMTGQAAEAVSLCLKMPQGICLRQLWEKVRRRAPPLYFPAPCGSSSFSWALPPHFPKNCCFAALYLSACVWRPIFLGGTWVGGIFGLVHGNWAQGIYAALMGLILAWLYEKRTVCGNLCYFTVQQI